MASPPPSHHPRDPAVLLDDVSCRYGRHTVLSRVTLSLERGTITGVLGPNGAGKSTLLGLVTGLRRPSEGTVTVLGEQLPARGTSVRRRIGVILQETALYEELTAAENLDFAASLYNVGEPKRRIAAVLELLGLSERAGDLVRTLSGGTQRRVAIARALLHDPELLVIDEPTLGVDAEARHAIWAHLRLLRSMGTTILAATNYLDEAQALCDTVAVLGDGHLLAHETPEELVARTGRCIDVECGVDVSDLVSAALSEVDSVVRIERTASGVTVWLKGNAVPDTIVRAIVAAGPISGFRLRTADLAEVFRALEQAS